MGPFMILIEALRRARAAALRGRLSTLRRRAGAFRQRMRHDERSRLARVYRAAPSVAPALLLLIVLALPTGDAAGGPLRPLSQPPGVTIAEPPRLALRPDGALVLEIFLSQEVDHQPFVLDPYQGRAHRLVVDLSQVSWSPAPPPATSPPGVEGLRYALYEPGRSRVVLDLAGPANILSSRVAPAANGGPAKLEVAFRIQGPAAAPTPAPAAQPDPWSPPVGAEPAPWDAQPAPWSAAPDQAPSGARAVDAGAFDTGSIAPRPSPAGAAPLIAPTPVASPRRRPDVAIIVIDPGHGGHDGGASYGGVREKDVVLEVAKDLRRRLHRPGVVHVYLTRTEDVFLTLEQRVEMASKMGADVFISLHADALPNHPEVSGASIYTLANEARDAYVASLVERENAGAPETSDYDDDWVTARLAESIGRRVTRESRVMASLFLEEFRSSGVGLLQGRPHRSGNFFVLRTLDMPAVLIELGFMTSANDRRRFGSDAWREGAVDAIARAVRRWIARDYDFDAFAQAD